MKSENTLAQAAIAGLLALGLGGRKERLWRQVFQACLRWHIDGRQGSQRLEVRRQGHL